MKCPFCRSQSFYVKDSEDEYQIHEFTWEEGGIVFPEEMDRADAASIGRETRIYCHRCAWQGKMDEVKE